MELNASKFGKKSITTNVAFAKSQNSKNSLPIIKLLNSPISVIKAKI
jgi:hypothetical protein